MKAVILAGGLGTRISEETHLKPKPMIEIGGKPILWHIMKIYAAHGVEDFIVCAGYRGYVIKEYFINYFMHNADVTIDLGRNDVAFHQPKSERWKVTIVDTGEQTMTGGRLKRVKPYLDPSEPFHLTYGDGVTDANLTDELAFHRQHGKRATLLAVAPPGRYGSLAIDPADPTAIRSFTEKPAAGGGHINAGFFILDPAVTDRIEGDATPWEAAPLEGLARDGELKAYFHDGFWQAMDTLRDKTMLEGLWSSGRAPWKVW
jgi:glucose-1-phosphate cytidylyltransferase